MLWIGLIVLLVLYCFGWLFTARYAVKVTMMNVVTDYDRWFGAVAAILWPITLPCLWLLHWCENRPKPKKRVRTMLNNQLRRMLPGPQ